MPAPPDTPQPIATTTGQALVRGLRRAQALLVFLLKWVLPLYVATEILKRSGALAWASEFLAPIMGVWGLPPEAAPALTVGLLVNLYGAAAMAAPLGLSWQQMSVLGLMLGIAHSLPLETAVVRQLAPGRHHQLTALRLALGLGAGWVVHLVLL